MKALLIVVKCHLLLCTLMQLACAQGSSSSGQADERVLQINEIFLSTNPEKSFIELKWLRDPRKIRNGGPSNSTSQCMIAFITVVSGSGSDSQPVAPAKLPPSFGQDDGAFSPDTGSYRLAVSQHALPTPDMRNSESVLTLVQEQPLISHGDASQLTGRGRLLQLPAGEAIPSSSPFLIRVSCLSGGSNEFSVGSVMLMWNSSKHSHLYRNAGLVEEKTHVVTAAPVSTRSFSRCFNASAKIKVAGLAVQNETFVLGVKTPFRPNECEFKERILLNEISWLQVQRTAARNSYLWGLNFVEVRVTYSDQTPVRLVDCGQRAYHIDILLVDTNASSVHHVVALPMSASSCSPLQQPYTDLLQYDINTVIPLPNVNTEVPLVCALLFKGLAPPTGHDLSSDDDPPLDAICMALLSGNAANSVNKLDLQQMDMFSTEFNLPFASTETFIGESQSSLRLPLFSPYWSVVRCRCCDAFDTASFGLTRRPSPFRGNGDICDQLDRDSPSTASPSTYSTTSSFSPGESTRRATTSKKRNSPATEPAPSQGQTLPQSRTETFDEFSPEGSSHFTILLVMSFCLSVGLILVLLGVVVYFNRRLKQSAPNSTPTYTCTAYINPSMLETSTNSSSNCDSSSTSSTLSSQRSARSSSRQSTMRRSVQRHQSSSFRSYNSPQPPLKTIDEAEQNSPRRDLPDTVNSLQCSNEEVYPECTESGYEMRAPYQAAMLPSQLNTPVGDQPCVVQNPYFNSDLAAYMPDRPQTTVAADDEDNDSIATEIEVEFRKTMSGRNFQYSS